MAERVHVCATAGNFSASCCALARELVVRAPMRLEIESVDRLCSVGLTRGDKTDMIQGCCHCGEVRWTFEGQPDGATICNCTVCRRYGVLWAYDYEGEGIKVSGKTCRLY